jgi:filamentous hemagglutinin family protein
MLNLRSAFYLLILVNCSNSWSEVTLDGSLGRAGALSGPDYQITEDLGQRAGSNLFHSFGQFNLQSAESATFSGNPAIQNVISRVTGGSPSSIDGALRSTIPNANLYFLNPAGVFFGPNASLDVQGSFHVSTADYLGLADGTRFSTGLPNTNQVLTSALPEAFGFLGDNPGNITLAQAELEVPNGKSLSIIGGDIDFVGGQLIAPAGRIDLVSVSSKGEVVRQDNDLSLNGFNQLGKIELTQSAKVDTSGEGGGAIFIRGGELTLKESDVLSNTLGANAGKTIDILLPQGMLEMRNGSRIGATSDGAGKGSDLQINAQTIFLSRDGSEFTTGLNSQSLSTGDGGDIEVTTESLEVVNGAEISAKTFDAGNGGNVLLKADSVGLSGDGADNSTGLFTTTTGSSGNAGDLTIQSNSLDVDAGARIATITDGSGTGGSLLIEAGEISLSGSGTVVFAGATKAATGDSKGITIKTDSLEVRNGALIDTLSVSTSDGANLLIEAGSILLTGDGFESGTGIRGGSNHLGNAGKVTLIAENVEILNGAAVSTLALGTGKGGDILVTAGNILIAGGFLFSDALLDPSGDAGNIIIQADNLELRSGTGVSNTTDISRDRLAGITSSTNGTGNSGDITIEAGKILVTGSKTGILTTTSDIGNAGDVTLITDNLELSNGTRVATSTNASGIGGNLLVTAGNVVLSDSSLLAGTTTDSSGNAGKVIINADNLELRDGSIITTSTLGTGAGGDLLVTAGNILLISGGNLNSLAGRDNSGNAGNIIIKADNLEMRDGTGTSNATEISRNRVTGISSATGGTGNAGDVTIVAANLDIRDGADISANTFGVGKGGDISIEGRSVLLSGDGSSSNTGLFSRSLGIGDAAGDAGMISITANDSLRILDGAFILVDTASANGGDIIISADNLLQLRGSGISTSVADGNGNGGNIFIGQQPDDSEGIVRVPNVTTLDNSFIIARAAQGRGGNIGITSDFLIRNGNSVVSASSSEGIDGTVNLNSPETNISGSIVALPENYINASDHLSKHCSAQTREVSSFVVKDRNTLPPSPDEASASTFFMNNPNQRFSGNRVVAENPDHFFSTVRRENINKSVLAEFGCGK